MDKVDWFGGILFVFFILYKPETITESEAPAEFGLASVDSLHDWMFLPPLPFFQNCTTAVNTANQNIFQHNFVIKYQSIYTEILLRFLKEELKVRKRSQHS